MNRREKGQALAETAIFSLLAVLLGLAILALVPVHRTRTAAAAAAYACAQFVSQASLPDEAVRQAETVARRTIDAQWSGLPGSSFEIRPWHAGGPGAASGCTVIYRVPILFNGLLGFADPGPGRISFSARSETWKAQWP